jgi:ATP-dependent Clp protease ATP-binding subunit ClpB
VLDDGRMTDGQGREVNFKNTIIVMTSNMGQDVIMRMLGGINPTDEQVVAASEAVVAQLRRRVAPEFINRIDNIVMFLPLTRDDIARIARLQLRNAVKRMGENGIRLSYTDRVVDYVVEHGYQPEYGGRPVKRVINASVVDAIGNALVNGTLQRQQPIECDVANGAVVFRNLP